MNKVAVTSGMCKGRLTYVVIVPCYSAHHISSLFGPTLSRMTTINSIGVPLREYPPDIDQPSLGPLARQHGHESRQRVFLTPPEEVMQLNVIVVTVDKSRNLVLWLARSGIQYHG